MHYTKLTVLLLLLYIIKHIIIIIIKIACTYAGKTVVYKLHVKCRINIDMSILQKTRKNTLIKSDFLKTGSGKNILENFIDIEILINPFFFKFHYESIKINWVCILRINPWGASFRYTVSQSLKFSLSIVNQVIIDLYMHKY